MPISRNTTSVFLYCCNKFIELTIRLVNTCRLFNVEYKLYRMKLKTNKKSRQVIFALESQADTGRLQRESGRPRSALESMRSALVKDVDTGRLERQKRSTQMDFEVRVNTVGFRVKQVDRCQLSSQRGRLQRQ